MRYRVIGVCPWPGRSGHRRLWRVLGAPVVIQGPRAKSRQLVQSGMSGEAGFVVELREDRPRLGSVVDSPCGWLAPVVVHPADALASKQWSEEVRKRIIAIATKRSLRTSRRSIA